MDCLELGSRNFGAQMYSDSCQGKACTTHYKRHLNVANMFFFNEAYFFSAKNMMV